MKINLFTVFFFVFSFFCFVFETPLKDFPFYSPILLTLWFRYLQTHIKENCTHLPSQLFFRTLPETLNFQKNPRKMHFSAIYRHLNFKNFSCSVYHGATELSKQYRNCIFGGGGTAVGKSAWIKAY